MNNWIRTNRIRSSWRFNMKQLKVMTIVGTRPEIIRLSAVMHELENCSAIEHIVVHTGQNYDYELNEVFFKDLELKKPDFFLNAATGGPMETIGNILIKIDPILDEVKPDAVLILGDTNSCLCAIAAKRRHIPIFHMEAGNRCFDERVPEETNRRIVDHISDINLTYSDIAREYLLNEGLLADRVIKTGSPMFEVIHQHLHKIDVSQILNQLNLQEDQYYVVSAHREENINVPKNFSDLMDTLNTLAEQKELPIIFSTHPRTRKMIEMQNVELNPLIQLMKPLGFIDYIKLQKHARTVLSDSGTISEESSTLGLKALNLRQAHERPEAMEEASVMMVGLHKDRILQALTLLEDQGQRNIRPVADYSIPNVSKKVVRIILSYIDYINRNVWKKY